MVGYPAGIGWDACTGWGSPKGTALLRGLRHFYGPVIAVNLQDDLQFGTVCRGPKFLTLEVFNVGSVPLSILSITRVAGSTDFSVLPTPGTPLIMAPGSHVDFTIEYNPTIHGVAEAATFQIVNDDPVTPFIEVIAHGFGGTASLETIIANKGSFGDCCIGSFVDEGLTLHNNGPCQLSITALTSTSSEFETPSVNSYPLNVAPGVSTIVPIRFQPTSFGSKSATITVFSNDPAGPKHVYVSGEIPPVNWQSLDQPTSAM